jgi:hypothetical protein
MGTFGYQYSVCVLCVCVGSIQLSSMLPLDDLYVMVKLSWYKQFFSCLSVRKELKLS